MKIIKWFDDCFEEVLLVALLVLISCVELAQVIIRNVPFIPALTWAEEFCRFCWVWSVFISLPYTIRKGSMLRVSALLDIFPVKARRAINITVDFIVAASMLLLGYHSVGVVKSIVTSAETSPAMLWPMWTVYSVMLLGFFGGALRAIQQAYIHITAAAASAKTAAEAAEEAEAAGRAGEVDK